MEQMKKILQKTLKEAVNWMMLQGKLASTGIPILFTGIALSILVGVCIGTVAVVVLAMLSIFKF